MGRTFLVLVALLSFISVARAEKSSADYWNESSITINNLLFFVNDRGCQYDVKSFTACGYALKDFSKVLSKTPVILYPKNFTAKHPELVGKTVRDFSDFILVEPKAVVLEQKSAAEVDKINKQISADFDKSLLELFNTHKNVEMEEIAKNINYDAVDKDNLKFRIGMAINLFLEVAIDPHTSIKPAAAMKAMMGAQNPSFSGIGIGLVSSHSGIIVDEVMENSTAEKAGVKVGDALLMADGKNLDPANLKEALGYLRGEENTELDLLVQRNGQNLEFKILRKKVVEENVTSKVLNDYGVAVGYIRMNIFKDGACEDVYNHVETLRQKSQDKMAGLILDLRSNPGGIVGEGSCIGHTFVGNGKNMVTLKSLGGGVDKYNDVTVTKGKPAAVINYLKTIPLVVLVNEGSASASEIASGALQDYKRAWLVGERTYGKGTAQTVIDSRNPAIQQAFGLPAGFYLSLTSDRFYLPSGTSNQIIGLTPEFVVPYKPNATEDERFAEREGDIYSNAFTPVTENRPNLRKQETAQIQACADGSKVAEETYAKLVSAGRRADYQMLKGEEILNCSVAIAH